MTKEELLEKGVSEEVADEIIAAFENAELDNPLELLEKALSDKSEKKNEKEEPEEPEEPEEDEYDEEYMRKYMRKYMKENKSACQKAAKELGLFNDDMKKAIAEIDVDAAGAIVEMTDLGSFLERQGKFNDSMTKAINKISDQLMIVIGQSENGFDILQKSAHVQVEQAKAFNTFLGEPNGRKGVIASMEKAKIDANKLSPEQQKEVYTVLFKATKSGDHKAGEIISLYESSGKDIRVLSHGQRQYINDLLKKEA